MTRRSREAPRGAWFLNASLIVTSLLLILALGALGGGIYWMIRRTSLLQSAHDAQAAAFERQMLAAMSVPAPTAAAAAQAAGMPRNAMSGASVSVPPPGFPRQDAGGPGTEQGNGGRRDAPLAASVIEKLGVAGIFQAVEGPLRTGNPDLHGTLISLRGGKRIGVLEGDLNRDDPALQALLRHVDGLIIEGPGGEPLFLKRFQSFLSEFFTL